MYQLHRSIVDLTMTARYYTGFIESNLGLYHLCGHFGHIGVTVMLLPLDCLLFVATVETKLL